MNMDEIFLASFFTVLAFFFVVGMVGVLIEDYFLNFKTYHIFESERNKRAKIAKFWKKHPKTLRLSLTMLLVNPKTFYRLTNNGQPS